MVGSDTERTPAIGLGYPRLSVSHLLHEKRVMTPEMAARIAKLLNTTPEGLLVTLEDVHILNRGADVVSTKEARLGINFLPLLQKKVRLGKIALKHPQFSIERGRDGKFNFETPDTAGEMSPALDLAKVSLSDGTLGTRTNNPEKDSRPEIAAWTCSVCGYQAGKVRTSSKIFPSRRNSPARISGEITYRCPI